MAAQGSCRVVVNLVLIVELTIIEQFLSRHRIGHIQAFDSALLVLGGFAGQRLLPVDARCHRLAILVLGYHIGLVARIGRVCQAGTEDRVFDVFHKLLILRVGHLCLVHPESVYRNILHRGGHSPQAVLLVQSHVEIATLHFGHPKGHRLGKHPAAHTCHFAAPGGRGSHLAAEAPREHHRRHDQTKEYDTLVFFHTYIL